MLNPLGFFLCLYLYILTTLSANPGYVAAAPTPHRLSWCMQLSFVNNISQSSPTKWGLGKVECTQTLSLSRPTLEVRGCF